MHPAAFLEQALHQRATNEAGGSGDEDCYHQRHPCLR
jgi:hypothetical protein